VYNAESVSTVVPFPYPVSYAFCTTVLTLSVSLSNMSILISHDARDVLGFNYTLRCGYVRGVGMYLHASLMTSLGGVPW
jgi:hypothetical protein